MYMVYNPVTGFVGIGQKAYCEMVYEEEKEKYIFAEENERVEVYLLKIEKLVANHEFVERLFESREFVNEELEECSFEGGFCD